MKLTLPRDKSADPRCLQHSGVLWMDGLLSLGLAILFTECLLRTRHMKTVFSLTSFHIINDGINNCLNLPELAISALLTLESWGWTVS